MMMTKYSLMMTFTLFWLISMKHINNMLFLWPHTMQQMTPTEKMETDMLMTSTMSLMGTLMNMNLMKFMKKKKTKLKEQMMLYMTLKMTKSMLMYTFSTKNSKSLSNIMTWTSIKKSSWFIMIIVLIMSTMIMYNMIQTRILYIPLMLMISMTSPSDPLMSMTCLLLMMMPSEMLTTMKTMNKNM